MAIFLLSNRRINAKSNKFAEKDFVAQNEYRIAEYKGNFEYQIYGTKNTLSFDKSLELIKKNNHLVESSITENHLTGLERMFYKLYQAMNVQGKNHTLFFIHGYSYTLKEEMEHIERLKKYYIDDEDCPVENLIYLSWPASSTVFPLTYFDDLRNSIRTGNTMVDTFLSFISFLNTVFSDDRIQPCGQSVHLMAHSMGNRVLESMLINLKENKIARVVDQIILLNSDVSTNVFENEENSFRKLTKLGSRVTVYINKEDKILGISKMTKNFLSSRLGKNGPSSASALADSINIVDTTQVKDDILIDGKLANIIHDAANHWGYLTSTAVMNDLFQVMNNKHEDLIAGRNASKNYEKMYNLG